MSAPCVGLFSCTPESVEYAATDAKITLNELFLISQDHLSGQTGDRSVQEAVRQLSEMLKNDASALAIRLQEVCTERLNFSTWQTTYSYLPKYPRIRRLTLKIHSLKKMLQWKGSIWGWALQRCGMECQMDGRPGPHCQFTTPWRATLPTLTTHLEGGGGASLEAKQLFAVSHVDQLLAHAVVMSHIVTSATISHRLNSACARSGRIWSCTTTGRPWRSILSSFVLLQVLFRLFNCFLQSCIWHN